MRPRDILIAGFTFLTLALGACWWITQGERMADGYGVKMAVEKWMSQNVADRDAEVIYVSTPERICDRNFRLVRFRALNGLGGPTIEEVMLREDPPKDLKIMTVEEFMRSPEATIAIQDDAKALKRRLEKMAGRRIAEAP